MGNVTVEKTNQLYWLGRYLERTHATLKMYIEGYDRMIDIEDDYYIKICNMLGIPNTYTSKQDFLMSFGFDASNGYSIVSNLNHCYDNAMLLRDEIGTSTLSYIHMAIDTVKTAKISSSPILELQRVVDYILAFWGCLDDDVDDRTIKDTIKTGKYIERLDIYLRLERSPSEMRVEMNRINLRIKNSNLIYNKAALMHVAAMIEDSKPAYNEMLNMLYKVVA